MSATASSEDPPQSLLGPGSRLGGRYEIIRLIGSGGMGAVFAAHDEALDREVAIKVLPPERARDRRAGLRFVREARALARLGHEGVVQLFDRGRDPRHGPYLVMEHLEGEDLARFLHARGRLALPLALALMEQICATLEAAHQRGIVHRDLKPGNVFVVARGVGAAPRLKVLDFGVAKWMGDPAPVTHPGELLGTLGYVAPEQWTPGGAVDARADIYAAGCVLYEMLTGAAPFRARTRAELHLAVLNDAPEPLEACRPDLPEGVVSAIERAMSKSPARRFDSAAALARALSIAAPARAPSVSSPSSIAPGGDPEYGGTARYQVRRVLRRGADVEVYAAWDAERRRPVALKRLRNPGGEASFRLKREFRAAAEIRHPNVVRMEALWEEDDGARLVAAMELVDGIPLLDYVQSAPARIRGCVAQLGRALGALHARGLAHRDVKPSNVLVDGAGRLVLLDCGLTAAFSVSALAPAPAPAPAPPVEGTLPYVAPEAFEGRVGPAGDLYALGVTLREMLARAPSNPPPADLAPLVSLCQRLLEPRPAQRATVADVLAVTDSGTDAGARDGARDGEGAAGDLSPAAPPPAGGAATPAPYAQATFIGRAETMAALDDAFAAAAGGAATVVLLEGPSGIGKTATLREARRRLEEEHRAIVLQGRARAGESVPFPALDEAIDGLSSHLAALPPELLQVLLPKRSGRLSRLFPVLTRVPALARAESGPPTDGDARTLRREACDVLRELLRRLSDRRPVVLIVDDLQWLDCDSAALLRDLLAPADPPPLLLIGALRVGDSGPGPDLRWLEGGLPGPVRRVSLQPLSDAETRALLRSRWPRDRPLDPAAAARLARQSEGVPFLAEMLVSDPDGLDQAVPNQLDDILVARQRALPEPSRRALELLCLSTRPLAAELIAEAIGAEREPALDPLFDASLVRRTRDDGTWKVEPYHARIAAAVRRLIDPGARRGHHRRLADLLRPREATHAESLIEHLAGCGDAATAAAVALRAAERAVAQLAFDRAAAFFAVALERGQPGARERIALATRQASALQNAGRRRDAGELLLRTAELADGAERDALRRQAGTHLLLSGDVTKGLDVLAPALAAAGLRVPADLAETIAATGAAVNALLARGLAPRALDGAADGPPDGPLADRVDLGLTVSQGLAMIDVRGLPIACDALRAALDGGDPVRLQRACALFVIDAVAYLPAPVVAPVLDLCRRLTDASPSPYPRALLDTAEAQSAHFAGDFLAAEAGFERAERTLLDSCVGATRELATARDIAAFIHYAQKGDFRAQVGRTQRWLAEADASGDKFHASMLRVAHAIVWIAHDQPERARTELRRAEADCAGAAGTLEVAAALYHDIIDRYCAGDPAPGAVLPPTPPPERPPILRNPAAQTPFLSGYLGLHAAWGAIRAAARGGGTEPARETIAGLRRLGLEIWSAVAEAMEANADYLDGARERALRRLDVAEQAFRRLHMVNLAACARKRRGQLSRAELATRLEADADDELRRLGVVDPDRWARAYWSMFDVDGANQPTESGCAEP